MATLSSIRSAAIEDTGFSSGLDSAQVTAVAGEVGLSVYSTLDNLPTSGLTSGDQAFVSSTNRFYISNGTGWYNVALINATPTLSIDPSGAVTLAVDGSTPTVITLTGADSDNADANLVYSVESDGSFAGLGTISQDSSVFTITPLGEDSATTETSTLTFKVSDGVSFGSGTTTFILSFITIVANSAETAILLKADTAETDNQVDASSNSHTITENGNVTSTAFSPYHPGGYSTYFDGNGDYLSIADDVAFHPSGDFTAECWIYPTASPAQPLIFGQWSNPYSWAIQLSNDSNRYARMLFHDGNFQSTTTSTVVALNTWTHLALVKNGSTATIYVNGVSAGTDTVGSLTNSTAAVTLGAMSSGSQPYSGYIANARLVIGTAVYTSNFTPPAEPLTAITNTQLLTCHLPYIADGSSNNHTVTANGNTSIKRSSPFDYLGYTKAGRGGSVYFDGSGDNLSLSGHSDFNMGSNFTFECWCYCTAIGGGDNDLLMLVWDGSSNNSAWVSYTGSSKFEFRISYVGGWALTLTSAGTFPINQWYHVAATRNSGTAYLFINGKQEATGSNSTDISSTGNVVNIGSQGSGRHFNGYIADARIINGTAVYTSAFTPPIAPLTAVTNTKLLTCTNKNDIWEQGSGTLFTKVGNTTASDTQRQFISSSAIYFDGTGDYLDISSSNDFIFGTGAFTIECWFYATDLDHKGGSQYPHLICINNYTNGVYLRPHYNGTSYNVFVGGTSYTFTTTIEENVWTHVAVVRDGSGNLKLFENGIQIGSTVTSADQNISTNSSGNRIGEAIHTSGEEFKGYVQDVRVTKGLARYTSNFTPPIAEFEG
jgi:hypothetical protein